MLQFVQTLRRLVPVAAQEREGLNRFARESSHDRAMAAFKADLATRAAKNTRFVPGEWQSRRS